MTKDFTKTLYPFFFQHRNRLYQLAILILGILAVNSILTDLHHYIAIPYDLRNRMIGARMLKDGLSPYFYQWHQGNPVRYYIPNGFLAQGVYTSEATSTPFLHLLLRPLAELNQLQFNTAWLLAQYAALAGTALALCRRLGSHYYLPIAAATILFTYSVGWRHQVYQGQLYILISLFTAWAYYYATAPAKTFLSVCSTALFCCMAVLIRPAFFLFFVPFIFQYKKYRPYAVAFITMLALWAIYACTSSIQYLNWADYFRLIKLHSQMHIGGMVEVRGNYTLSQFEGIDIVSDNHEKAWQGVIDNSENTAAYMILQRMGIKVSVMQLLLAGSLSVVLAVLPMRYGRWKNSDLSTEQMFILAFCTFFLFDFFSPVVRSTYYFCLWLFPVLLFFVCNRNRVLFLLAIAGIALNIFAIPVIKMEHTIGQGFLLIAFLLFVYKKRNLPAATTQSVTSTPFLQK